jgi:rare lipoprotein A
MVAAMLGTLLGAGGSAQAARWVGEGDVTTQWMDRAFDAEARLAKKSLGSAKAQKQARKSVAQVSAGLVDDDSRPQKKGFKASAPKYEGGMGSHYQSGIASYYWQPQRVASGGWFNPNAMTAAHKTLPFGTKVRVTNNNNGRSVVVTINDRGPYIAGRVIDLSAAAAGVVGMKSSGLAPVSVAVLGR